MTECRYARGRRPPPPARFTRPRVGAKWHRLENPKATNRFHQRAFCGTPSFPAGRRDWIGPGGPRKTDRCRTCETLWTQYVAEHLRRGRVLARLHPQAGLRRVMEREER
jgi:hypothetical protein